MVETLAVDTNVIVRFLTGDDPTQSPAAISLFRAAASGRVRLLISTPIIQETVYVLETFYEGTPETIAPKLLSLLNLPGIICPDSRWMQDALHWYRAKNADFGDAILCAFAQKEGFAVATFDKGLIKKFPEVPAREPEKRKI
jgi:predicted nucleic-acid-binding protein